MGKLKSRSNLYLTTNRQHTLEFSVLSLRSSLVPGVDTSLHVAAPLRADIALQHGQLTITMKTPIDIESQKVKPVIELKVMPYTLERALIQETFGAKIIHTTFNVEKMLSNLYLYYKFIFKYV